MSKTLISYSSAQGRGGGARVSAPAVPTPVSISKESIHKIREICAMKYNPANLPHAVNKCKLLLKDHERCLCSLLPGIIRMGSVDLSTFGLNLCKQNCGFCQIKMEYLYDLTKNVPFHIIQRVIPVDILVKHSNIVFSILETRLYELSTVFICDLMESLFSAHFSNIDEDERDEYIVYRLTNIIKANIHRTKKMKKDAVFTMFYEIVKYVSPLTTTREDSGICELITNALSIIDCIFEYDLLDQLDIYKIADLVFYHFNQFKFVLMEGFKNQIKRESITEQQEEWMVSRRVVYRSVELTNEYITRILVNYDRPICHIDNHLFSFILQLPSDNLAIVMRKITSACMISLISTCLFLHPPNRYFELHVDPQHMINTAICRGNNLSYTIDQFLRYKNQKPYIIYENENGQLGIDAGGLTRDFYTQYFLQLKQSMVLHDDIYMTFPVSNLAGANSLVRIRFAGILTAYSIFRESISPNIRFHPLVSYFIIHGSTIQIDHLLDFLADDYEIEFAANLRKILCYSCDEYREYMDMQGEDPAIPPKEYLKTVIQDHYITPAMVAFIRGFRDVFIKMEEKVDLFSYIKPNMIHEYMVGIESYTIFKGDHSLESILKVDCGDDVSMSSAKKENIRQIFLGILDEMNRDDIGRLKSLLRFWHGTHGIQDFQHLDLTLRVLYGKDDLHGCFSSSTCFGKLYVHHRHLVGVANETVRNNLVGHIERTLENQRLVESAGMYMQMD